MDFRPLFRHAAWVVSGVLLIILASAVEVLELVLPPKLGDYMPINPRAIAISLFCLATAWVLGHEFLLTGEREQRLAAENRLLDALMQFRLQTARDIQHEVGNKLTGISTPLRVALLGLEQGLPPFGLAERLADALAEAQALEVLIQTMLNNARMEAGQAPRLEPPEPTDAAARVRSRTFACPAVFPALTSSRRPCHTNPTVPQPDSHPGSQTDTRPGRHSGDDCFVFADGHARWAAGGAKLSYSPDGR